MELQLATAKTRQTRHKQQDELCYVHGVSRQSDLRVNVFDFAVDVKVIDSLETIPCVKTCVVRKESVLDQVLRPDARQLRGYNPCSVSSLSVRGQLT